MNVELQSQIQEITTVIKKILLPRRLGILVNSLIDLILYKICSFIKVNCKQEKK